MTVVYQPLSSLPDYTDEEQCARARSFLETFKTRRTVRDFSERPVPIEVVTSAIQAAGLSPSGANGQPWYFAIVQDAQIKRAIRLAAEEEERAFYEQRAPAEWLDALAPLGTDSNKPFLETAPLLIVVFQQLWSYTPSGKRLKNYYVTESVGIATGVLLACLHSAGLATLTHTPSPMGFLRETLRRPNNEKAAMIVVVGHPASNARVPVITKKSLSEISSLY